MMLDMMSGQLHSEDALHSEELAVLAGDIRPVDLGEAHNRARDEVAEKGRTSGLEHGVAILPDGTAVSFGGEHEHYLDVPRFDAPEGSVTVHHNHPSGDSFSRADIRLLLERSELGRVDVHGHAGLAGSCERIGPAMTSLAAKMLVEDLAFRSRSLTLKAYNRGKIPYEATQAGLWQVVMALLLEKQGFVRYALNSDAVLSMAREVIE